MRAFNRLAPLALLGTLLILADPPKIDAQDKTDVGKLPDDWSQHVVIKDLTSEISDSVTRMGQNLKKASDFDKFLKNIQAEGHLTAILAGLVLEHPEAGSWKAVGADIQTQALEVAKAAEAKGVKNFRTAQESHKKITEFIKKADSGAKGPDGAASSTPVDWSSLGSLSDVMKRVEVSYKFIRGKMSNKSAFERDVELVRHNAAVLYILSQISPAFRASEADMVQLSGTMSAASVQLIQAVGSKDHAKANEANAALNNACNECHKVKRFQKKGSDFDF